MIGKLLFPPRCVLCRRVLEGRELDVCTHCRIHGQEPAVEYPKISMIDTCLALWYYEGAARASVLRFKFYGRPGYAKSYGRLLAARLSAEYPEGFDCITWVPTGPLRKFRRGYDQAWLLAREVGRELGQKPGALLKKVRNNPPQSGITGAAARRANVLGAYRAADPGAVAGKRILLLDDIVTTGATASECARVLLTAGASEVHLAAVTVVRRKKTK